VLGRESLTSYEALSAILGGSASCPRPDNRILDRRDKAARTDCGVHGRTHNEPRGAMRKILPDLRFARRGAPAPVSEDPWGRGVQELLGPAATQVALHHTPSASVDRRGPRRLLGFPEIVSALPVPHNPDGTASPNSDMPVGWRASLLQESLLRRYSSLSVPCTDISCYTAPVSIPGLVLRSRTGLFAPTSYVDVGANSKSVLSDT